MKHSTGLCPLPSQHPMLFTRFIQSPKMTFKMASLCQYRSSNMKRLCIKMYCPQRGMRIECLFLRQVKCFIFTS